MKHYDYLIVGAGLFGSVFAYEARKSGKTSLVIDKRDHIAGNVYTKDVDGIHVHEYGAHIFHTSDRAIWDYINQFAEFNNYINSPIAVYKDELYNMPFNMNTFSKMWGIKTPAEAQAIIEKQRTEALAGIDGEPSNLEEQALSLVGRDVYEKLVKGYTEKQWGRPCDELPAFIIKRLPLRFTYDNNYFNDRYQGIPIGGYTPIVEKMLDGIDVVTGLDFFKAREADGTARMSDSEDCLADEQICLSGEQDRSSEDGADCLPDGLIRLADGIVRSADGLSRPADGMEVSYDKLIFTGQIDAYYDYQFGPLEYRSVRFETEQLDMENYQGNAVVNYTDADVPYTRVIEHKHFEFGKQPTTVISREYSSEWQPGSEPYYPVNNARNNALYEDYAALAAQDSNVIFGGRLGQYKYYDMDKVIASALELVEKELR